MKQIYKYVILIFMVLLSACASRVRFPTSSVAPAADIFAKKKVDKQENFYLEITVKNLASVDRLTPPGGNYSIWIVTTAHGVKNIGQLNAKNAKKTTFKTVTPFDFDEIFITVENTADLERPTGIEIARTKI